MRIELAPENFDHGVGDFDIGHVLTDTEGNPEIKIVKFTGYTEIDDADGTEHETNIVHFADASTMDFEDLQRAVFITRTYQPVSPDWFVEAVNGDADGRTGRDRRTAQGENRSRAQGEKAN